MGAPKKNLQVGCIKTTERNGARQRLRPAVRALSAIGYETQRRKVSGILVTFIVKRREKKKRVIDWIDIALAKAKRWRDSVFQQISRS